MKFPLLIFLFFSAQFTFGQTDTIYFKNGKKLPCLIGKVGVNNFHIKSFETQKYEKVSNSDVEDYIITDNLFKMTMGKRMEVSEVYEIDGYKEDEIYRALLDWVLINQKHILSTGISYANKEHSIVIGTLYTETFYLQDLPTILKVLSDGTNSIFYGAPEQEIPKYQLHYTVKMRAKDNRIKIAIDNMQLVSTYDNTLDRPYVDLYRRRIRKNGETTTNLDAIHLIKKLLVNQIESIKKHAEYVRINDTLEARLIREMLQDDEW